MKSDTSVVAATIRPKWLNIPIRYYWKKGNHRNNRMKLNSGVPNDKKERIKSSGMSLSKSKDHGILYFSRISDLRIHDLLAAVRLLAGLYLSAAGKDTAI
jgi:hypothetical protein